jgi:hypothetical protein
MKIKNIVPSTLKITASEKINIKKDLETQDPEKPLSEILNEKEKKDSSTTSR